MCNYVPSSTLLWFAKSGAFSGCCSDDLMMNLDSSSAFFGRGLRRLLTTTTKDGFKSHSQSHGLKNKFSPTLVGKGSNEYELGGFKDKRGRITSIRQKTVVVGLGEEEYDDDDDDDDEDNSNLSQVDASSSKTSVFDFLLQFNEKKSKTTTSEEDECTLKLKEEEDLIEIGGSGSSAAGFQGGGSGSGSGSGSVIMGRMRRSPKTRQFMKRSNMIAKQVISLQSALSLGFLSQLWVDTNSWVVLVLEVRPNLLSGEIQRFLLDHVSQVGDVVLIQDESVIENEFKLFGLETLVGYTVVTPSRRYIGKVRGFTFNINSGAVESLELDSFGISIIPSTLVSTYALFVDDVLEVVSDTVVVDETAATHIQRITKGVWEAQKMGNSIEELGVDSNLERQPIQSDQKRSRRRSFTGRELRPKKRDTVDDWELPMDYL